MTSRRADGVAEELENLIVTGELADGERLDEARLSERFGVSRTPVREALQKLAAAGFATQSPNRGTFVHQPGIVELLEMFEVMAELEAACARFACRRLGASDLEALRSANATCRVSLERGCSDGYFADNETFHQLLYRLSGNTFLHEQTLRLHKRLRPYRRMQLRLRGRLAQSMAEHDAVIDALEAGDEDGAARALRDHVAVQGEKFRHLLASMKPAAE